MIHQDPHSKAADAVHEGRPVEAQYTRQGRPGVRILWLLIVSAGAAAVLKPGRLPERVSAASVNWLTSNSPPPVCASARFIRPASSANTR